MNKRGFFGTLVSLLLLAAPAHAQWSIGAPGSRIPPAGQNRYAYFVLANPVPGHEADFNEWYNQVHLGDLGQLDGWVGAQRFRLMTDLKPPSAPEAARFGYMALWNLEGANFLSIEQEGGAALGGGKARRGINAFNYNPGGSFDYAYRTDGPRTLRPDGKRAFMPPMSDTKTPRPWRYIMTEYTDPRAGLSDGEYEKALDQRIAQVLAVPGWMAAQRFRFDTLQTRTKPPPHMPKYLIIWEAEGPSAQTVQDAIADATAAGRVTALDDDKATEQTSYWQTIGPYVTKDMFSR